MKIENPFESGHIKNYILAYVSVVVIMILFFIATTLWNEPKSYPKREFKSKAAIKEQKNPQPIKKKEEQKSRIRLLQKAY